MARFGYHRPPGPREDEMANREGFGRDQEEPKPDYPQQRRQAVQEARKELDEAPSPEDFSSYPPLEASPAERFSTGQEAASEALEDQQQRRLQKSMVDRVKSQGIRAAESIGIPLGMAMQPQQTVDMAPDPLTGRRTHREAATLANQDLAQNRREIKQWMKDNPGLKGRQKVIGTGGEYRSGPWNRSPQQPIKMSTSDVPVPDPKKGFDLTDKMAREVASARIPVEDAQFQKGRDQRGIKYQEKWKSLYDNPKSLPDLDPKVRGRLAKLTDAHIAKAEEELRGSQSALGKAEKEFGKAKAAIYNNPAYKKWVAATAKAMDRSQEFKNLSAMASDLTTGVAKAAGGISGGMALLGIITGGLMVGHEVLKELGDADDTAIPKTLRFIAQNQEASLYDYHVAPEAAAQLTIEDIEALYQDGTLSHEFYTQLKGR